MNTLFISIMSKKTSFTNINTSISPFAQAFSDCSIALGYYTNLANALTAINQLISDFSVGNFNGVTNFLTLAKYNQLSLIFNGLQKNATKYGDYEKLRVNIVRTIQGLMQTIQLYLKLGNMQNELTACQATASILTDMAKLQDYIETLKGSRQLFPDSNITVISATIKPQYSEYIKRFGYPASGIFEVDKLSECINFVNQLSLAT